MKLQTLRAWCRRALVALLLGSSTPLVAQQYFPNGDPSTPDEHGARWVFGGLVSFWQDNKAKTTTFYFSPEVGYLFNENWGLGVVGTYQYQKGNGESERRDVGPRGSRFHHSPSDTGKSRQQLVTNSH